jgi:uncharacterized membrane protein
MDSYAQLHVAPVVLGDSQSSLSVVADLTAQPLRIRSTTATLTAVATMSVDGRRFRTITDTLSSTASLFASSTINARAQATLNSQFTETVDGTVTQGTRTLAYAYFTLSLQIAKTTRIIAALASQTQVNSTINRIRTSEIHLSAFDTVLAVGRKIAFDPCLMLHVEPETRLRRILPESRYLVVEQETRDIHVIEETRLISVLEETRLNKIKGC